MLYRAAMQNGLSDDLFKGSPIHCQLPTQNCQLTKGVSPADRSVGRAIHSYYTGVIRFVQLTICKVNANCLLLTASWNGPVSVSVPNAKGGT